MPLLVPMATMDAMSTRIGPRPDLGYSYLHEHLRPLPQTPVVIHLSEAACTPGQVRDQHAHRCHEICYVMRGRGERRGAGGAAEVGPGDVVIVPPGEDHGARADRRDPYHYFALGLDASLLGEDGLDVLDRRLVRNAAGAEGIFRRMLAEFDRCEEGDERARRLTLAMIKALLVELLVFIGRRDRLADAAPGSFSRPPSRPEFQELARWLRTRLAAPPALAEMAARCRLTPAHFTTAFRRDVGVPPMSYLATLRVDAAARRLIDDRRRPVTAVALDLGFASSQHFAQVFRRVAGCTPSAWRERHAA